jgi:hypothetical protein
MICCLQPNQKEMQPLAYHRLFVRRLAGILFFHFRLSPELIRGIYAGTAKNNGEEMWCEQRVGSVQTKTPSK